MKIVTKVVLIAAFLAAFLLPADGHDSWINSGGFRNGTGEFCCGEHDCHAVSDVRALPAGYLIYETELVPYSETQPSQDGLYWVCRRQDGTRRCFFAPVPAS